MSKAQFAEPFRLSNKDEALPFCPISCDGGFHSDNYQCSNMFLNDSSCYCTLKRQSVNVVAELQTQDVFTINSVEVAAPHHGYTCPLGHGIVFVCWGRPNLDVTSAYNGVSCEHEMEAVQNRLAAQGLDGFENVNVPQPVLFFDLGMDYGKTYDLDIAQSGRYVVIKLLRARNRNGPNIDVQYIGLHGWSGRHAFAGAAYL